MKILHATLVVLLNVKLTNRARSRMILSDSGHNELLDRIRKGRKRIKMLLLQESQSESPLTCVVCFQFVLNGLVRISSHCKLI